MKTGNTKKVLIGKTNSATILYRKVAGFVMQSLKQFWNNWQWVLALAALLYGIFLFYYNSSNITPTRITECEKHLARHEQESKEHFARLDKSVADLNILNEGIKVQLESIKEDTSATKRLLFELLGKRL
jgi:HKD family nuclease